MMFGRPYVEDWRFVLWFSDVEHLFVLRDLRDPRDKSKKGQGSVHVMLNYEGEGARSTIHI